MGVPDQQASRGEKIIAFVSVRAGKKVDTLALRQHMKERLATYKLPSEYFFQAELPVSPAGKVQRRALKESYLQGIMSQTAVPPETREETMGAANCSI